MKLSEDDFHAPLAAAVLIYQMQQQGEKDFQNQKQFDFANSDSGSWVLSVNDKKYTVTSSDEDGDLQVRPHA